MNFLDNVRDAIIEQYKTEIKDKSDDFGNLHYLETAINKYLSELNGNSRETLYNELIKHPKFNDAKWLSGDENEAIKLLLLGDLSVGFSSAYSAIDSGKIMSSINETMKKLEERYKDKTKDIIEKAKTILMEKTSEFQKSVAVYKEIFENGVKSTNEAFQNETATTREDYKSLQTDCSKLDTKYELFRGDHEELKRKVNKIEEMIKELKTSGVKRLLDPID